MAIRRSVSAMVVRTSRGLIGSLGERIVVASPIYKHHFDLRTGECLEIPENSVNTFATRVKDGQVWVAV